jgi:hypothetical protein
MTLEAYDADRLDQLALRMLDSCGRVRDMARQSRDEGLENLQLHDRKALEYLSQIEQWLYKAEAEVKSAAIRHHGRRHAQQVQAGRPK